MALAPRGRGGQPTSEQGSGNGSQPDNHTAISLAFCLFYEKDVLPTGFRSKFTLIGKERKFRRNDAQ